MGLLYIAIYRYWCGVKGRRKGSEVGGGNGRGKGWKVEEVGSGRERGEKWEGEVKRGRVGSRRGKGWEVGGGSKESQGGKSEW